METVELKKMSVAEITGLDEAGRKAAIGHTVARIAGNIDGYTLKATQYGQAVAFIGEFGAINEKGEKFTSNLLYMPDRNASDLFQQKVDVAQKEGGSVDFVGEVVIAASTKSKTGYTYIFRPVQTEEKKAQKNRFLDMLATNPAQLETKKGK